MNPIYEALEKGTFLKLVLSPPRTLIRKIEDYYQLVERKGTQEFHKNLSQKSLLEWLQGVNFKQGQLFTLDADYHLFFPSKVIKLPPSEKAAKSHNRQKIRLLDEAPKDKQRQIERFLQEVKAALHDFQGSKIRVVDFGCGKAYLTFALYQYLSQKFEVEMVGIDLKQEVIEACQKEAPPGLRFICGPMQDVPFETVDLAIALHACNTATDDALKKALELQAKVILVAPCCQHEFYQKIDHSDLKPLLKHGILKERLASLVTDAARGLLLETEGYSVKIVEFIDSRHTPKNLLIRAIFTGKKKSRDELDSFLKAFRVY